MHLALDAAKGAVAVKDAVEVVAKVLLMKIISMSS